MPLAQYLGDAMNKYLLLLLVVTSVDAKIIGSMPEVDDACRYLTAAKAKQYLGQEIRPAVIEHIPDIYSQCGYKGKEKAGFQTLFVFKFYPEGMLNYENIEAEQLDFNVTFINGGKPFKEKAVYPGEATYVFEDGNTSTVFLIPGVTGPEYEAGKPMRLGVMYQLTHPHMEHEARKKVLTKEAWFYMKDLIQANKNKVAAQ